MAGSFIKGFLRLRSNAYGAGRALRNLGGAVLVGAGLGVAAVPALAAEAPVTIAALGDSLTAGYGLAKEDGFVPRLSAWLDAQGVEQANVLNAGVSGDTTKGGLGRVDWTLTEEVDAMIVALGGNDALRGVDPAETRANLSDILAAARDKGVKVLLIGIAAPGNYGPDYRREFDAIFPELAEEYGALAGPNFLAPLRELPQGEALAKYMQADGIHPNADGVGVIVEALGPYVLELIGEVD